MEKTISIEEKIRRAEEIYERRKNGNNRSVATVDDIKDKKDLKLLKKMMIQILICVCIYLTVYAIRNNNYIFSEDFINQVNQILLYDTNFSEIYQYLKEKFIFNNKEDNNEEEKGVGGAELDNTESNVENKLDIKEESNSEEKMVEEEQKELTQEEKDIDSIKSTTSFIKPVEGTISSKFGQRDTATGRVPKNHTGVDIAANLGTKILSSTDGEVVIASEEGDYGKHLKIQIGEVSIIYAHCNNLYVKTGDKVKQGQEIAEVGSTGNSTRTSFTF